MGSFDRGGGEEGRWWALSLTCSRDSDLFHNWLGVMTSYMFTCSMILIYIGILLFSWNEPAAIIYWTTMRCFTEFLLFLPFKSLGRGCLVC